MESLEGAIKEGESAKSYVDEWTEICRDLLNEIECMRAAGEPLKEEVKGNFTLGAEWTTFCKHMLQVTL